MRKLLSIVAPMYNEEALAREYFETTVESLKCISDRYDIEIVLVNDGSTDNTLCVLNELHNENSSVATVVNLTRNFGLEGAVKAGLTVATGDVVVVMDSDLQDPPSIIVQMIAHFEEGCDVVVAKRSKRENDSMFKRLTAKFYYAMLASMSGNIEMEAEAANYRLLSREAADTLLSLTETNSVFRVIVPFIGMRTETIEYERDKRFAGKTKFKMKNMIPYALNSVTSISIKPLRCISLTIPITMILFLFGIMGIIFFEGQWKFFAAVVIVLSVLFGMLFICISIIAEYLGQIMIETKARPMSLIYQHKPCKNAKGN